MTRKEVFANAELYLADCRDILPTLDQVDAVVTDPRAASSSALNPNRSILISHARG